MAFPVINGTEVLLAAPEGWVVDFTHPYPDETTKIHVFLAFGIEFPVATLFLAQRIYTSLFVKRKFRIDDFLAKLVLCIFYYRLSPARWYRCGILLTAFLCIGCFGSVWLAVMFACRPVAAAWNFRLLYTGGNCIRRPPWYLLQAIAGGVTDLLLMLHPLPAVLGLQRPMSAQRKSALLAWFGLGTVTLAAAVMRLLSLLSVISDPDTPWTMPEAMLWLVVESNLIVLCGCLPTFRVFVLHVTTKMRRTDESQGSSRHNNNSSNKEYRGSGNSSSDQGIHQLRTLGAGSTTRREFDTIADIELGEDRFRRPAHYYYHRPQAETGNDTTCFAGRYGDAASHPENGSEVQVLVRHTSTRKLML
ncbi:hypothetical protein PG984_004591 [Apiospora sp. TS-2023a]